MKTIISLAAAFTFAQLTEVAMRNCLSDANIVVKGINGAKVLERQGE